MGSFWKKNWSPYVVGVLIGLLGCFSLLTANHTLGASTTFVTAAGWLESLFSPKITTENAYYAKILKKEGSFFNWQSISLLFVFVGAWVANQLSAQKTTIKVPSVWKESYGRSYLKRAVFAFLGGMILVFGARIAGGCTSGNGISGGMQFAVAGWAFFISLFATAACTAFALYKR